MAYDQLSNLANALSQTFAPKLSRQFNRICVTSSLIRTEPGFGKNVAWDVIFSGASAGARLIGGDVAAADYTVDTPVNAILAWSEYSTQFAMTQVEIDAAESSIGVPDALGQLVAERIMDGGMKLASSINKDLINGTGSNGSGGDSNSNNVNIVGFFGGALPLAGNSYAGISTTTYTEFASNILANGGVPRQLTIDLMEKMDALIYSACGEDWTELICDPQTLRKYSGILEPLRRIDGISPFPRYGTSTALYTFKDRPVYRDKDFSAGTMLFVNSNHAKKVVLPFSQAGSSDVFMSREFEGEGGNGDGVNTPIEIPFQIIPLAKTGPSVKFQILCHPQLKVNRPSTFGIIQDIQTV